MEDLVSKLSSFLKAHYPECTWDVTEEVREDSLVGNRRELTVHFLTVPEPMYFPWKNLSSSQKHKFQKTAEMFGMQAKELYEKSIQEDRFLTLPLREQPIRIRIGKMMASAEGDVISLTAKEDVSVVFDRKDCRVQEYPFHLTVEMIDHLRKLPAEEALEQLEIYRRLLSYQYSDQKELSDEIKKEFSWYSITKTNVGIKREAAGHWTCGIEDLSLEKIAALILICIREQISCPLSAVDLLTLNRCLNHADEVLEKCEMSSVPREQICEALSEIRKDAAKIGWVKAALSATACDSDFLDKTSEKELRDIAIRVHRSVCDDKASKIRARSGQIARRQEYVLKKVNR